MRDACDADDPIERPDGATLDAFVALAGRRVWTSRIAAIREVAPPQSRAGQATLRRHCVELAIERMRSGPPRPPSSADRRVATLAATTLAVSRRLGPEGKERLRTRMREALSGQNTLVPLFHLVRTARLQAERGFTVDHAGLNDGAPFDLLLRRDDSEAELACDAISAEEGRGVHRGAWFDLADRIDPDLQTWLAAHPGRYLLKLTLPQGLRRDDPEGLAVVHARIQAMLHEHRRSDQDAAVVLRLDPLMLAAAQADEIGLMSSLRREFGPEAHLSVTAAGGAVFAMAARASREDAVAVAVRHRLAALAPARLTGRRPGILALFVEDTDHAEWRLLRERLTLEAEARQFLTRPEARSVVAVTCASRAELFGAPPPFGAGSGELRFRNPGHPAAKRPALAPSVLSSV